MSFARAEPGAEQALAAAGPGGPLARPKLGWPGPAPRLSAACRHEPGHERDAGGGPQARRRSRRCSVVLAGGGTAGHIEPALALADALRRADPRIRITCLGTERGLETRLVPARGYDLALIPRGPAAPLADPAAAVGARPAAAPRSGPPGPCWSRSAPTWWWASAATWRTPGLPGGPAARDPDRGARGELPCRPGQPDRRAAHRARRSPGQPGTRLAHATCIGIPMRREIAGLDRLGAGDKARAHFGLDADLPVLLVTGGSQGARSINRAVAARGGAGSGGRHSGAAHHRAALGQSTFRRPGPGALRRPAVPGPDGPGLRRGRLRAVPGRRDDVRGADRGRAARGLRAAAARQRRAAAERRADRGRRRRPDR